MSNISPTHYTKWAIAPSDYITANKLEWEPANIVKYVTRYEDKNGLEDLLKTGKYLSMLIARKYGEDYDFRKTSNATKPSELHIKTGMPEEGYLTSKSFTNATEPGSD